jgi:hypothetical protein
MELQSSLTDESPVVTLKSGHRVSSFLVKQVMSKVKEMQEDMKNGAILLNDLVMRCRDENHEFFIGCQWKLAELGFLDTNDNVIPSMREIILSSAAEHGNGFSFHSPIAS